MHDPTDQPAPEAKPLPDEKALLKRFLLCRTDRLGDVILALPCALLVKRLFPDCRVTFLVQPYTAPIVSLCNSVDDVIELDPRESLLTLTETLRERDFQTAILLFPHRLVARAVKNAAIPIRAGIAYRWYSYLFNYRHPEHRKFNLKHEVEYNLALTYATFTTEGRWEDHLAPDRIFPLPLEIPREAKRKAADFFPERLEQKYIVLHPGGSGSAHRWPVGYYCELARSLKSKGWTLVITGNTAERTLCRKVSAAAGDRALNLCQQLTLTELAAVYQQGQLLITNSTGPLHLARALGTPVLGLFPADKSMTPQRWGPFGLPDSALTPSPGKGMETLSVDTVFQRILDFLEDSALTIPGEQK